MKFLVIGGTGLIGGKVVARLRAAGHEALAAAPSTGVDILTGAGLDAAMAGADTVIDLSNSPSFEDAAVLEFFATAGRTILAAEARAGVGHHLALSVVGTHKLAQSGYFRAKIEQERLIRESNRPYTIVHSTQFFEFLPGIVQSGADGERVRLPQAQIQPIAAEDVAAAVARPSSRRPTASSRSPAPSACRWRAWHSVTCARSRTRAKPSPTRTRATSVPNWTTARWCPRVRPGSARWISTLGWRSPGTRVRAAA
nr:NmrA family NAD(P)-binding protein [Lysobacter enzymogenes]